MEDLPEELQKLIDAEKQKRLEEEGRRMDKPTTNEFKHHKRCKRKKKLTELNKRRSRKE